MSELLLFPCAYGEDDPERATVPFIAATTAAVSGQRAVVVCTVEAVYLGLAGTVERIHVDGMPPLADLAAQLAAAGGEVWLCSACVDKRGISASDPLLPGASIVGAARLVEALTEGRAITLT